MIYSSVVTDVSRADEMVELCMLAVQQDAVDAGRADTEDDVGVLAAVWTGSYTTQDGEKHEHVAFIVAVEEVTLKDGDGVGTPEGLT